MDEKEKKLLEALKSFVPKNMLRFYGENDHFENYKIKTTIINPELINDETTDIMGTINIKLKNLGIVLADGAINSENEPNEANKLSFTSNENVEKYEIKDENGQAIDITGYFTYQFLEGTLNDYLLIIRHNLKSNHILNYNEKELFSIIIDIILYCANIVESNLKNYKIAYYNRKLLIVSQLHAILVSFDSLIFLIKIKQFIRKKKLINITNIILISQTHNKTTKKRILLEK